MRIILILVLFTSLSPALASDSPPIPGNWELSFFDGFDYLDSTKWNTSLPRKRLVLGGSSCFFQEENVSTANGNLVIKSIKKKLELKNRKGKVIQRKYSSGQINSFGKFAQSYGYFEARIKLPTSAGLWPAFWLMPNRVNPQVWSTFSVDDKKGMEIDIMESLVEWGPNIYHYAAHWDGYKERRSSIDGKYKFSKDPEEGYRTFGLYWGKNILIWFIDGIEIHRWQSDRIANIPMHMILSTEMGGWATDNIKDLPDETYVDYVKVWAGEAKHNPIQEYNINSAQIAGKWKKKKNHTESKKAWFRKNRVNTLSWDIPIQKAGRYKVSAKWPHRKKNLTNNLVFIITHGAGISEVKVNQNEDYNYWYPLGEFDLEPGLEHVVISSKADKRVVFGALRYELLTN